MGIIRPATPGFLITCVATVLLAVVSFCVPYFKSVYFLKANISFGRNNGTITFGTLGYCLELSNGTTCSNPTVGYQLDINSLIDSPVDIPVVVVKWLTYCLVLHLVALGLAAVSALFGLLAHVREMSMTCFSTCISGFAAAVALLAFIFDIAIFFAARARINAVGSAEIGNATWLTLAAWVLLFFSGCFYTIGRCCISTRRPREDKVNWNKVESIPGPNEAMRLDAVKAEADRKARQNRMEGGLPAFHEVQPLTGHIDGDRVYVDDPSKPGNSASQGERPARGGSNGGYVQKPPGTRAVDEYYSPTRTEYAPSTYPPAPQNNYGPTGYAPAAAHRQPSGHARSQYSHSNYAPSTYATTSPPSTQQYPTTNQPQYADTYYNTGAQYGHAAGGSSYHTAASSHERQETNYTTYNPYESQQPAAYNSNSYDYSAGQSNYYQAQPGPSHQNDQNYTLDDNAYPNNGYGASSVPPIPEHETSYFPAQASTSPPFTNTNTAYAPPDQTSSARDPRAQNSLQVRNDDDSPPSYEAGTSVIGAWGKHT